MNNNQLTPDEVLELTSKYANCPKAPTGKLILKQVKHMTENELFLLCYWVNPEPFARYKNAEWVVEREFDIIKVKAGQFAFHVLLDTCNVHLYLDRRLTPNSNNGNTVLFYFKRNYAFPLFIDRGHWANGKTLFQLGLAVPDPAPLKQALLVAYDNDKQRVQDWFIDKQLHEVDLTNYEIFEQELFEAKRMVRCSK